MHDEKHNRQWQSTKYPLEISGLACTSNLMIILFVWAWTKTQDFHWLRKLLFYTKSQSFILRKFGVIVKHKQGEPSSHTHMWTHGPESNWGRYCAAEKHCPPKLCYNYQTLVISTHTVHAQENETALPAYTRANLSAPHTIYNLINAYWYFCTLHPIPHPQPRLTIQSEAGGDFLGVVAQPIVARLLPHCVPLPHLYIHSHTQPYCPVAFLCLPLLINYSGFCQDTYMHAHADPHTLTDTEESADAQGWAVGAWAELSSGWVRRWHQIRILQYGAILLFSFESTTDPQDYTAVSHVAF